METPTKQAVEISKSYLFFSFSQVSITRLFLETPGALLKKLPLGFIVNDTCLKWKTN